MNFMILYHALSNIAVNDLAGFVGTIFSSSLDNNKLFMWQKRNNCFDGNKTLTLDGDNRRTLRAQRHSPFIVVDDDDDDGNDVVVFVVKVV